ncbi:MAG: glycosyltransferase [Bacteroides sp.]|nr:glycosyltransferase [Bacteroides sp.]
MSTDRPLKVVFISHSDVLGGAGVVTYRLMHALRRAGIDARMIVYTRLTDDPNVASAGTRFIRGANFLSERLGIWLRNGMRRENLFKVSTATTGLPLHRHPWVKEADIIALGWINQGLLSLKGLDRLGRLGKPIVWTMHDMWCLTGICHHSYECRGYRHNCGNCQWLLGREKDLSSKIWKRKMELFSRIPITFVAVSNWLAERCHESRLLSSKQIEVIHNPFPADYFAPDALGRVRYIDTGNRPNKIVMCAARLDDPIKGLHYAIDALNYIASNKPELAKTITVLFVGALADPHALDNLKIDYYRLGRVNDPNMMRDIYTSAKVVLSTSLYETLPTTLAEGQATGCLPVTFGRGGQSDIVTHLKDGYIARYKDPESIAEGIEWALQQDVDRQALNESVRERFSSSAIAGQYIDLFKSLLDNTGEK